MRYDPAHTPAPVTQAAEPCPSQGWPTATVFGQGKGRTDIFDKMPAGAGRCVALADIGTDRYASRAASANRGTA